MALCSGYYCGRLYLVLNAIKQILSIGVSYVFTSIVKHWLRVPEFVVAILLLFAGSLLSRLQLAVMAMVVL